MYEKIDVIDNACKVIRCDWSGGEESQEANCRILCGVTSWITMRNIEMEISVWYDIRPNGCYY